MATSDQEVVDLPKIEINAQLVQLVDKKVSKWLEQKEPNFNAAILIAMAVVEEFSQEADGQLTAKQKKELAIDLVKNVLNSFARYKSDFVAKLDVLKEKMADIGFLGETIDAFVSVSTDPNSVNARWAAKKTKKSSCFGRQK